MKQLRIASGETHGKAEMPVTCAPLVFPALDAAVADSANEGSSGFKAKLKSTSKFVSNYFDRRAQATYVCPSLPTLILRRQSQLVSDQKAGRREP